MQQILRMESQRCCFNMSATGVSCVNNNRNFIDVELDQGYFERGLNESHF
jgi:hypothetical protein